MDDKLKSTINKIQILAEHNTEFKNAMQKLFGNTVPASTNLDFNERISHIEKYLGLDYYSDFSSSIIDYSYIQEVDVRTQLISDNREMLRFRYGTRFHSIIFEEFCRYAQLQAEMLLNYYYYKKNSTISDTINHIKKFNASAKIDSSVKSLGAISFSTKLWAFGNEFKLSKETKETFDYVREVRNFQSHRSPSEQDFSYFDYQKELVDRGIQLKADGLFDYYNTKKDPLVYNIYESKIKNTLEFKMYQYYSWYNKKPYDEVISSLKDISETIKKNL
ncbi:MAG: hypothetical protein IJS20_02550 [Bacteroidales bacterium]|nr:hypothetical protein [Bacteroidales bacterium]